MMSTQYTVILEQGDDSWGAHVPDLPGCIAAGQTRAEALSLIQEAIVMHIEGLEEQGLPVPAPRTEAEVVDVGA